jgi:hypothetical protein
MSDKVLNDMKKSIMLVAAVGASLIACAPSVFANAAIWIDGVESPLDTAASGSFSFSDNGITVLAQWNTTGPIYIDFGVAQSLTTPTMIAVSDNNNPGAGPGNSSLFNMSLDLPGSTVGGTISAYWSPVNILGMKNDLLSSSAIPSGGLTTTTAEFDPGSSEYSLTEVLDITSGSGPFSGDFELGAPTPPPVTIPDGGTTMALLGIGLAGLGAVRNRFSRKV